MSGVVDGLRYLEKSKTSLQSKKVSGEIGGSCRSTELRDKGVEVPTLSYRPDTI